MNGIKGVPFIRCELASKREKARECWRYALAIVLAKNAEPLIGFPMKCNRDLFGYLFSVFTSRIWYYDYFSQSTHGNDKTVLNTKFLLLYKTSLFKLRSALRFISFHIISFHACVQTICVNASLQMAIMFSISRSLSHNACPRIRMPCKWLVMCVSTLLLNTIRTWLFMLRAEHPDCVLSAAGWAVHLFRISCRILFEVAPR